MTGSTVWIISIKSTSRLLIENITFYCCAFFCVLKVNQSYIKSSRYFIVFLVLICWFCIYGINNQRWCTQNIIWTMTSEFKRVINWHFKEMEMNCTCHFFNLLQIKCWILILSNETAKSSLEEGCTIIFFKGLHRNC